MVQAIREIFAVTLVSHDAVNGQLPLPHTGIAYTFDEANELVLTEFAVEREDDPRIVGLAVGKGCHDVTFHLYSEDLMNLVKTAIIKRHVL